MLRNYPITIAVAALSIASLAVPSLTSLFELDFAAVGDGQWWRILTGHWTHYDFSHLLWDLLMFVTLSVACERRAGKRYAAILVAALALISLAVRVTTPEIMVYRGLSGIDTGLFVWLAVDQIRIAWSRRDRTVLVGGTIAITALIGKLVFEAATGQTLFVDSSTFTPLVQSHLAGAIAGAVIGVLPSMNQTKVISSSPAGTPTCPRTLRSAC